MSTLLTSRLSLVSRLYPRQAASYFILFGQVPSLKRPAWFSRLPNSLLYRTSLRFRPLDYNILEEIAVFSYDPEDKQVYVCSSSRLPQGIPGKWSNP